MGCPELCLGRLAEVPYYFNKMLINVYSVEELCFCIQNEAYLIDSDIVDRKLAEWIDAQCGLHDLGAELMRIVRSNGSPAAFAGLILEYTGYQTREEIAQIEGTIRDNSGKTSAERGRTKADFLFDKGRYADALQAYEKIISELPENEMSVKSQILYDMGSAQMHLFNCKGAQESFMELYKCIKDDDALKMYLVSKRMDMRDEDYISFISEHSEYMDASSEVEGMIGGIREKFDTTDESRMLFTLKVMREDGSDTSGNPGPYYAEIDRIAVGLKDRYREMVQADAVIKKPSGEIPQESK